MRWTGVQNLGVEVTDGVLSRPVSPKLAHEAVLAKPPYFDAPLHRPVQNEGKWCPKYRSDPQMTQMIKTKKDFSVPLCLCG